jgi:hypothetical protein
MHVNMLTVRCFKGSHHPHLVTTPADTHAISRHSSHSESGVKTAGPAGVPRSAVSVGLFCLYRSISRPLLTERASRAPLWLMASSTSALTQSDAPRCQGTGRKTQLLCFGSLNVFGVSPRLLLLAWPNKL